METTITNDRTVSNLIPLHRLLQDACSNRKNGEFPKELDSDLKIATERLSEGMTLVYKRIEDIVNSGTDQSTTWAELDLFQDVDRDARAANPYYAECTPEFDFDSL